MPGIERRAAPGNRRSLALRKLLAGILVLSTMLLVDAGFVTQACAGEQVLIVSRKRVLNETDHAKALSAAETSLTAELQGEVDKVKEGLTAEEHELARLRTTLDRESFEQRVAEFDSRVRRERRDTQERAALLQNAFRDERVKLVGALGPVLDAVRLEHGASLVLNSDVVLAADPVLDVTDEVIERFNATVPPVTIPRLAPAKPPVDQR